ncbi:histidine acid phosphatase, partial [Ancylostoma ceylanicum]
MGLLAYSTFLSVLWIAVAQSPTSLQFVEFWFRHGERLPTHYVYFPTDPQPLIPYTEAEAGELTNRGIQEAFQRGELIRKKYGNFLGSVYRPSQIHVWTGNDNRTVTSAQAVLAGAYKPDKAHQWSSILDWQPVAVHTDPTIDWITLNDTRLPYPKWAEPIRANISDIRTVFHQKMVDAQNDTAGKYHAELLLSYIEDHLNRPAGKKNKAVFVSGHDTNFMTLGRNLNITPMADEMVSYAALLAVELHLINGTYFVK